MGHLRLLTRYSDVLNTGPPARDSIADRSRDSVWWERLKVSLNTCGCRKADQIVACKVPPESIQLCAATRFDRQANSPQLWSCRSGVHLARREQRLNDSLSLPFLPLYCLLYSIYFSSFIRSRPAAVSRENKRSHLKKNVLLQTSRACHKAFVFDTFMYKLVSMLLFNTVIIIYP